MKNKNFLGGNDRSYEAAKSFRKMLHERKAGWYRGSVDYYLNDEGKIERLDETKILFSGEDVPSQVFKPK